MQQAKCFPFKEFCKLTRRSIVQQCIFGTFGTLSKVHWQLNISSELLFQLKFMWLGFLSRNYWSWLDHDLMASFWEKAISILAGNLNSRRSYLITAVLKRQHNINTHREFSSLAKRIKESNETYLLELTPYKGLWVVVCLLNGH